MSFAESKILTEYPYPYWGEKLLFCIDIAIKQAWDNVLKKHSNKISHYNEVEITDALECELQIIMDKDKIPGFDRTKFQSVVRGGEFRNFDGKNLEKKPDLFFRKIQLTPGIFDSRYDALFIECKVINGSNQSPLDYIKDGVRRFVDGEYAWCMQSSVMIAYVRDNKKFPKEIKATFKRNTKNKDVTKCDPIDNLYSKWNTITSPQTYKTVHTRTWTHPDYGMPGNIEISHTWFDCP